MILDQNLLFSDNQSLAQAAGTYLSDKSYDIGVAGSIPQGGVPIHDIGRGADIDLLVQIGTAVTSAGAATLQVNLVAADDAALSSNLTVLQSTPALAKSLLVSGYQVRLGGCIPPGNSQRYIGLQYVIATATITAGTVTAGLVLDKQTNANSL